MLLDVLKQFDGGVRRVVLASQSPRRRIILEKALGDRFIVQPSTFPEDKDWRDFSSPTAYVTEYAQIKAKDVWDTLNAKGGAGGAGEAGGAGGAGGAVDGAGAGAGAGEAAAAMDTIVIGCDTVVVLDGVVLEKPDSPAAAAAMVAGLAGATHTVCSGVCVLSGRLPSDDPPRVEVFSEATEVTMAPLPQSLIDAYVATDDPYDKAGGYGIQSIGASFVTGIHGCYYNVMGLPLAKLTAVLRRVVE